MGSIEIITKLSRLKSVSSIDNDYLETVTWGVLKNFVNLQENGCVGVSFWKSCRPASLLKRDSNNGVFLCMLRNFLEHLFGSFSEENVHWN